MEEEWIADRARLRPLWQQHPTWRVIDFARAIERAVGRVVKWMRRLQAAPRIPGPRAILYDLRQSPAREGHYLPRSSRTVYRVLKAAGLIAPVHHVSTSRAIWPPP